MGKEDEEVERNSIKIHFTIYSINFNVDGARFGGTTAHCEVNTFFFVYASRCQPARVGVNSEEMAGGANKSQSIAKFSLYTVYVLCPFLANVYDLCRARPPDKSFDNLISNELPILRLASRYFSICSQFTCVIVDKIST